MPELKGKIALITGAGRGIGRATALLFAEEGADLFLTGRTSRALEETAERCRKAGGRIFWYNADLSEIGQINELFDKIREQTERLDILINNAGHFDSGAMVSFSPSRMEYLLRVNLIAPFYLSRESLPLMTSGGSIVNISSFSGCFGVEKFPGFGAYNISKYGLWGLTEILALENRNRNIRVNQISPSGVDTEMFRRAVPPGVEPDLSLAEVARHILYLASDESYPLSGENIMLAGMPGGPGDTED